MLSGLEHPSVLKRQGLREGGERPRVRAFECFLGKAELPAFKEEGAWSLSTDHSVMKGGASEYMAGAVGTLEAQ